MKECPTCHRPFGALKRSCFACKRPILKKHKWHIHGCYIQHDDCQNPTMRQLVPEPAPPAQLDIEAQIPGTPETAPCDPKK